MKLRRYGEAQDSSIEEAVYYTILSGLNSGEKDAVNSNIVLLLARIVENMPVACISKVLPAFEVLGENE